MIYGTVEAQDALEKDTKEGRRMRHERKAADDAGNAEEAERITAWFKSTRAARMLLHAKVYLDGGERAHRVIVENENGKSCYRFTAIDESGNIIGTCAEGQEWVKS